MICQDDTFRTFRVGGLNCFFSLLGHHAMPPVPPLLPPFSVLQNSLGLPSATRHQRGGVSVWRFWVPMRREAQFFLSSAMSELPWSSYSCPSLFIFTLSWRDASTSSPTLELQVSFYFVEPKILTSTYNCCYIVVFFRKNLWDWKTPGQSNEKLPTRGWGSKNITLRLPRSWPRGAKPGFQLIFLIIGSPDSCRVRLLPSK